ncbi:DUF4136 domain-containing protein [Vibrio gallicus]|uniref:DUF4136 domain-containing protein n=1 Tax=Vibrio gallicus TaxID=190897 RepID=UPI0021C26CC8|nr:DUF4136 domain-containing protein [Vibrio gallicus]
MKWISTLIATLTLTACVTSTPEHENNFSIGVVISGDFQFIPTHAKTYAWHPDSGKTYINKDMNQDELRKVFNHAIEKTLADKGYIRVDIANTPQFIVGYGLAIESQLSDDELFAKTQLSTGIPAQDFKGSDEKGTLFIALFDYPMLTPKWKALAQSGAASGKSGQKQRIEDYVTTVLRDLPAAR